MQNDFSNIENNPDFREIKDWPGYFACKRGYVVSLRRREPKILKSSLDSYGYPIVRLSNGKKFKTKTVHRLIMAAFHGDSSLHVNHIDFNKQNNALFNLEYLTNKENQKWTAINGRRSGEMNSNVRLDWARVLAIYTLKGHTPYSEIGKLYGLTGEGVSMVARGKNWLCMRKYFPCEEAV